MAADAFHTLPAGKEAHGVSGDGVAHLLAGGSDGCGVVVKSNRGYRVLQTSFAFHFGEEIE